MAKKRRTAPVVTPQRAPSSGEIHLLAALTLGLAGLLAWWSRGNLNVDGVAYLDLAARLQLADWRGFVQGYWSPAYPTLLAVMLAATGASGAAAITVAHLLNFLIAAVGVFLLWRMALARGDRLFATLAFTAFLVSSARTLRLDAVTPDLALLVVLVGLGGELLRTGGGRGWALGTWGGAAYLVKTSVLPWLVVATVVGLLFARRDPAMRRAVLRAALVTAMPIAVWIALLSLDAGRFSSGGTARFNACWYLEQCDGRTPDTHRGQHQAYRSMLFGSDAGARVAEFTTERWTYAPWSDPAAWQRDVVAQARERPTAAELLWYWGRNLGLVVGLWAGPLWLLVVLPLLVSHKPPGSWRTIRTDRALLLTMLGAIGVAQFVAVHAEPRLIAPFLMLATLGLLDWWSRGERRSAWVWLPRAGFAVALGIGLYHLRDQGRVTASSAARTVQLERTNSPAQAPHRVAIIGTALPMLPDLYRARAIVVAQVFEPGPDVLATWREPARVALARALVAAGAEQAWLARGRDAYSVVSLRSIAAME